MGKEEAREPEVKEDKGNEGKEIVSITVNGNECKIHRGRQTVAEIKRGGNVPAADELSQIIDGKITPLADDGSVVIKGGEIFVSNVRSGSSSQE